MVNLLTATLICTGMAPTTPATNIEVEIRPGKFSTIRYEIAEGSLAGTAYVQSIGHMIPKKKGSMITFQSGDGPNATKLVVHVMGDHIHESHFSHYISGMKDSLVECMVDDDSGDHGDHSGH